MGAGRVVTFETSGSEQDIFPNMSDPGAVNRVDGGLVHALQDQGNPPSTIFAGVSVAEPPTESSQILASCVVSVVRCLNMLREGGSFPLVEGEAQAAEPGSALAGFGCAWRAARAPVQVQPVRDALAEAAASDVLSVFCPLLGQRRVDKLVVRYLPEPVVRRPGACVLLDVAVGAGAVQTTKCLLELHRAIPTLETLKMAISSGVIELVRMIWGRLPSDDQRLRLDLMEVAADFHRDEVLGWLFRDGTIVEREFLTVLTLERRLADAILAVGEWGFRPWWRRTQEAAAEWPAVGGMMFFDPPEGFSFDGGWRVDADGSASAIPKAGPVQWTSQMSNSILAGRCEVNALVLPYGLESICGDAFRCARFSSVIIQPGIARIENGSWMVMNDGGSLGAFCRCASLRAVTIPPGCEKIGGFAFCECRSLTTVTISAHGVTIAQCAFRDCASLRTVVIRGRCGSIEFGAFASCKSLLTVVIRGGCTTIGTRAFDRCTSLTAIGTLRGCKSIGEGAFRGCTSLANVTIPKGCLIQDGTVFSECEATVTRV